MQLACLHQHLLSKLDRLQPPQVVEAFELPVQLLLECWLDAAVRQKPIARRRWSEADLVDAGADPRLGLQPERRLEAVGVEVR